MLVANDVLDPLYLGDKLRRRIPAVRVWIRVGLANRLVSGVNGSLVILKAVSECLPGHAARVPSMFFEGSVDERSKVIGTSPLLTTVFDILQRRVEPLGYTPINQYQRFMG